MLQEMRRCVYGARYRECVWCVCVCVCVWCVSVNACKQFGACLVS